MTSRQSIDDLFSRIDAKDVDGFLDCLHPEVSFRFGNAEPVQGVGDLRATLEGFFGALEGIQHQLEQVWVTGRDAISHGRVTYTRLDGSRLSVPFANIFRYHGNRIRDYRIFVDNSALFSDD